MRFGSERHGPSAPVACHDGKYETRTSTGTPTRLTWKFTWSSVDRMSDTVTAASASCCAGATPSGAFAHDAGSAYQRWATGSHDFWAAPTPVRTSGRSFNGVTSEESCTR